MDVCACLIAFGEIALRASLSAIYTERETSGRLPFFLFTNGQSVSASAELGDASLKSGIYKKEGAPI